MTRDECLRAAVLRSGEEVKQDLAQLKADGRIVSVIAVLWKRREEAVLSLGSPNKDTTAIMQAEAIARVGVVTEMLDDLLLRAGLGELQPESRS